MSQLFVFLTFILILIIYSFLPTDYGRDLSSVSSDTTCEKQLDDGMKIVSVTNKKYVPCWFDEKENF